MPDIENPGGFTITSPPSKAFKSTSAAGGQPSSSTNADHENPPNPYLELAVQKSPDNIVAKWLWQPVPSILSSEIQVRVGGSFVWPPPGIVPTVRTSLAFLVSYLRRSPLFYYLFFSSLLHVSLLLLYQREPFFFLPSFSFPLCLSVFCKYEDFTSVFFSMLSTQLHRPACPTEKPSLDIIRLRPTKQTNEHINNMDNAHNVYLLPRVERKNRPSRKSFS